MARFEGAAHHLTGPISKNELHCSLLVNRMRERSIFDTMIYPADVKSLPPDIGLGTGVSRRSPHQEIRSKLCN